MSLLKTSNLATGLSGNSDNYIKDVNNDLTRLFQTVNRMPDISTGTAVPTTTPSRIGNIYVDTTNKKVYISSGHSSSADWLVLN